MATTRDYVTYLNNEVDIAPTNSQEELEAAEAIERIMGQHDVDVHMQEFDAPAWGGLVYRVLMAVMFVGIVLAGMQGTTVAIVGIVVSIVSLALFVCRYLGYDLIGGIGPHARSQNVIAVHRATGPLAEKANRPIVIVAHYDTPRDNVTYLPQFATFRTLLGKYVPYFVLVAGVCALFQALFFVPDVARRLVWVLGIVVALPLLALGATSVAERFAACTDGANDNKSGVAALLGVLSAVSPAADVADGFAGSAGLGLDAELPEEISEAIADPVVATPVVVRRYEQVVGMRHGKKTLDELRILPADCEIVYREPKLVSEVATDPIGVIGGDDVVAEASGTGDDLATRGAAVVAGVTERGRALFGRLSNRFAHGADDGGAAETTDSVATPDEGVDTASNEGAVGKAPAGPVTMADGITFSTEGDPSDSEASTRDDRGLGVMGDIYDRAEYRDGGATRAVAPSQMESQARGQTAPSVDGGNIAKRAVLLDLPDPSSASSDPFATGTSSVVVPERAVTQPHDETTAPIATPDAPAPVPMASDLALLRPDDDWKGGAQRRDGLRLAEDDEASEELREAMRETVLGMNDDALVAHDIWFVALGASTLDNAGMRVFLDEHRRDIRGAFIINLSCVGAGALTLLTREGVDDPRRADRRLVRLVTSTADDLHVDLDKRTLDWDVTDATVAMRRSLRSVTLMGMDDGGVPALSHTADDVAENVDAGAVTRVAELVCEIVRRS